MAISFLLRCQSAELGRKTLSERLQPGYIITGLTSDPEAAREEERSGLAGGEAEISRDLAA